MIACDVKVFYKILLISGSNGDINRVFVVRRIGAFIGFLERFGHFLGMES